ncbi:class I SAM-dependent methyltransferase [Acidobacteria bacterium AH-259-A15]|nr:class I SAM-dependent methyltransferase [Acidobacteria bacterium AH-259-A15]
MRWKELVACEFLKVAKLPVSAKILDIGCAEGCFCLALRNQGLEAHGIEPSEPMVNYARNRLKLRNIKCTAYSETTYGSESFDAIHCFHVLEHILDINSILRAMHLHLKPGGILALSVPSVDLAKQDTDFDRVLGFDHIYNFSETWFKASLSRYGFKIFEIFLSPFNIEELGPNNPGKEFNVSETGDGPGRMYAFARKK